MRNLPRKIATCCILYSFCEDKRGERLGKDLKTDGRILLFEKLTNSPREQYMPLLRISYAAFFSLKRRKYMDAIILKTVLTHESMCAVGHSSFYASCADSLADTLPRLVTVPNILIAQPNCASFRLLKQQPL